MTDKEISDEFFEGSPFWRFDRLIAVAEDKFNRMLQSYESVFPAAMPVYLNTIVELADGVLFPDVSNSGDKGLFKLVYTEFAKRLRACVLPRLRTAPVTDAHLIAKWLKGDVPAWLSDGRFMLETPDIPDCEYSWMLVRNN